MIKCTEETGSYQQWTILDTARSSYNPSDDRLFPNEPWTEISNGDGNTDILSNGFKIRVSDTAMNASSRKYIYMAFAEHPFAATTPATAR